MNGMADPDGLFDAGLYNPKTKTLDVQRWLNAEAYLDAASPRPHEHEHQHGHGHGELEHADRSDHHDHGGHGRLHQHAHDVNRHDAHIKAVCLTLDEPVEAEALERWLDAMLLLKGPDMLRVKGIVNVAGLRRPVVIHGVQHIFHPPVRLKKWPSKDRRTRIVFITRDIDETMLRDTLRLFTTNEGNALLSAIAAARAATDELDFNRS
jgi:G3E family GTPase